MNYISKFLNIICILSEGLALHVVCHLDHFACI